MERGVGSLRFRRAKVSEDLRRRGWPPGVVGDRAEVGEAIAVEDWLIRRSRASAKRSVFSSSLSFFSHGGCSGSARPRLKLSKSGPIRWR